VYLFTCANLTVVGAACDAGQLLVPPPYGPAGIDLFLGMAVAVAPGGLVVASAVGADGATGALFLFTADQSGSRGDPTLWVWRARGAPLVPTSGAAGDTFGWALALGPRRIVVGAPSSQGDVGYLNGFNYAVAVDGTLTLVNCDASTPFFGDVSGSGICYPCSRCSAGTCYAGLTGNCTCASAAWVGPTCSECAPGRFGLNCTLCTACEGTTCVEGVLGVCVCSRAQAGPTCSACAPGYAGAACAPCSTCTAAGHGRCVEGRAGGCVCDPGWDGVWCDERVRGMMPQSFAAGTPATLAVLVVVPLGATALSLILAAYVHGVWARADAVARAGPASSGAPQMRLGWTLARAARLVWGAGSTAAAWAVWVTAIAAAAPPPSWAVALTFIGALAPPLANIMVAAVLLPSGTARSAFVHRTGGFRGAVGVMGCLTIVRVDSLELPRFGWFGMRWPLTPYGAVWMRWLSIAALGGDALALLGSLAVLLGGPKPAWLVTLAAVILTSGAALVAVVVLAATGGRGAAPAGLGALPTSPLSSRKLLDPTHLAARLTAAHAAAAADGDVGSLSDVASDRGSIRSGRERLVRSPPTRRAGSSGGLIDDMSAAAADVDGGVLSVPGSPPSYLYELQDGPGSPLSTD
jgi:hypothetical protein